MFTGLDAIRHGVNYDRPMPTELPTLAERLQAAGYETLAVTGGVYLHPRYGLSQGFNAYAYWDAAQTSREDELVRGMERSLTFIERNADRAFFLYLHTYDVHAPYGGRRDGPHDSADEAAFRAIALDTLPIDASNDFALQHRPRWLTPGGTRGERLNESEVRFVHSAYDSGITFVDAQLARLFDRLRTSGLERDTIVVLTSD